MIGFTLPERVFIYGQPVDMRKSFDGLFTLVSDRLGEDPLSGDLFLFLNRRRNCLKGLLWDRTGFLIIAKRLERGQFHLRSNAEKVVIEKALLRRLLDGVAVGGVEISRSNNIQHGPRESSSTPDARGHHSASGSQPSARVRGEGSPSRGQASPR
jgi:transposase